jgi:hypothetical protein
MAVQGLMMLLFPLLLQIREHCKELLLTDAQIREVMNRLLEDIQLGLRKDTHEKSIVKCFVTYVQDLPNGTGKLSCAGAGTAIPSSNLTSTTTTVEPYHEPRRAVANKRGQSKTRSSGKN